MPEVVFIYKGKEIYIQCNSNEKLKHINQRFTTKMKIDMSKILFLYGGENINEELEFNQIANKEDKKRMKIKILVYETNNSILNNIFIQSEHIICPTCKEMCLIKLNNYKINLYNCPNKHNCNSILIEKYKNTQKINISQIICGFCKDKSKAETFDNKFYKCYTCNINLCPICKDKHDKKHNIINYDKKDYKCSYHNEKYSKFCFDCNKNICVDCQKDHKNHKSIYYGDIIPGDIEKTKKFYNYIEKLNNNIDFIINNLTKIKDNILLYFDISNSYINNNKNKNYQILKNINEFINYNNIIMGDIKEIVDDNDINNKFKKLNIMYEKMNSIIDNTQFNEYKIKEDKRINQNFERKNYIIAEINIKEIDVNKNIRILNSFEEYKKKNKWEDSIDDYKSFNEEEIRENCEIKIDNKIIPFSFFHSFPKKGIFTIQYSFRKNLTKTNCMFACCKSLIKIDLSNFNTENVTNISHMFRESESIVSINLSGFNTEKVENMDSMFDDCKSLFSLDLSSFKTKNVKSINSMFWNCISLKYLNISNFNLEKDVDFRVLFHGCDNLKIQNLITKDKNILEELKKKIASF